MDVRDGGCDPLADVRSMWEAIPAQGPSDTASTTAYVHHLFASRGIG
jgi:hypothetical protein